MDRIDLHDSKFSKQKFDGILRLISNNQVNHLSILSKSDRLLHSTSLFVSYQSGPISLAGPVLDLF